MLGFNAQLYYLSTGSRATWANTSTAGIYVAAAPSNLVLITGVTDLTNAGDADKANASSRDGQGSKYTEPALIDFSLTFKLIWKGSSQTDQMSLLSAFIARSVISCAALDQAKAASGALGFWVDYKVLKFAKGEPLDELQTFDCELSPCLTTIPPQIVQVM